MKVAGNWLDGVTSAMVPATLTVSEDGLARVTLVDGGQVREETLESVTISPRLGQTPRYVYFSAGGKFETRDNDQIDQWVKQHKGRGWDTWVDKLESHWQAVAASLVVVIFMSWALVVYGVPAASNRIAHWIPDQVPEMIGAHVMELLDEDFFEPTTLSQDEQQRILDHFQPALDQHPDLPLRVLFRDGGSIGPNAFALPDGTMVFTDQIVALSRDDDELLSVLAHEIGHVAERHSMQGLVRSSLMGFIILAVTGDVSASSELLLGVPLLLMELSHSRKFESQADDFALDYMRRNQIEPSHFINIMSRMESSRYCLYHSGLINSDADNGDGAEDEEVVNSEAESESVPEDGSENSSETDADEKSSAPMSEVDSLQCFRDLAQGKKPEGEEESSEDSEESWQEAGWLDYLSSHPPTEERLEKFR